jgi:hypothetical protein
VTASKLTRALYGILSAIYIVLGIGSMLTPAGWIPAKIVGTFLANEIQSPFVEHLLQEFGTILVALGLVFFWQASQKVWSATFHWAMTFYFLLDALIHWIGPDGYIGSPSRGIVNTIPLALMLVVGFVQLRASQRTEIASAA